MNNLIPAQLLQKFLILIYLLTGCMVVQVHGQERPPKPIIVTVSTLQHLSFGTFIQAGTYGTVTVDHTGFRSATGNIILPNMSSIVTPALFEIEAIPGTLITIVNGPDSPLHGNNGGNIMLKIENASTGTPFLTTSDRTNVFIGGTLTVGPLSANPAGNYSGTFQVTFIQQ